MNKTLTINISGVVFHIEEDAYEKLKNYLVKITSHFNKQEGGYEIISDIEARISELFLQKTTTSNGSVVTDKMVDDVIKTMGVPEDFEVENEELESTSKQGTYYINKKLYRDPDSRVLGGVCSGLSYYLNVNKAILRIIFIILFLAYGAAFFAYIILWIAVPKARTTTQRLEMRGEPINVENIDRSVKDEFSGIGYVPNRDYENTTNKNNSSVFRKIVGAFLLFIGFISLTGVVFGLFGITKLIGFMPEFVSGTNSELVLNHVFSSGMATTLFLATFIIVGIPLLLIIYAGTKLLFNYSSNSKSIVLSALAVWIIGIILATSTGAGAVDVFSTNAHTSEQYNIETTSDTLYISIGESKFDDYMEASLAVNNVKVLTDGNGEILVSRPKFTIEPSSNEIIELDVYKESKGNNYRTAKKNAENIQFEFKKEGNKLILNPYFEVGENQKWRNQYVNLTLSLPEGKTVFLNDNLLSIINDIENTSNTWDGDMTNAYWTMLPEGLTMSK